MATDYSYMLKNNRPIQRQAQDAPSSTPQGVSQSASQDKPATPFYDMVMRGFMEGGAKWPALLHHPGWEQQFDQDLRTKYPKAKGGLERFWQSIGDGLGQAGEMGLEMLPAAKVAGKFGNFLKFIPEKYRSAAVWSLMNAMPDLKNDRSQFMNDFGRNLALSGLGTKIITSSLSKVQKGLALGGIGAGTALMNDPKDMATALASAVTAAIGAKDSPGGKLIKQLKATGNYSPNQLSQIGKAANDFHEGKPVDPEMLSALKQNKPNPALDKLFSDMEAKTPNAQQVQNTQQEDTIPTPDKSMQPPSAPAQTPPPAPPIKQGPTPQEQAAMRNHFFPSAAPKVGVPPQPAQPPMAAPPAPVQAPMQVPPQVPPVADEIQAALAKMPPELQDTIAKMLQQNAQAKQQGASQAPVALSVQSHMGTVAGAYPQVPNVPTSQQSQTQQPQVSSSSSPKMSAKDAEAAVLQHVKNPSIRAMIQRGTMQSTFGDPSWGDIGSHMALNSVHKAANPQAAKEALDAYRYNVIGDKAMPTDSTEKIAQYLSTKLPPGTALPHSNLTDSNQEPRIYDLLHGTGFTSKPQDSLDAVGAGLYGTPEQGLAEMQRIYDSKIKPGANVHAINQLKKLSPFNITAGQRLSNLIRNLHAAKTPDHPAVAEMHKLAGKSHDIASSVSMLNSLKGLPDTGDFRALRDINTRDWPEAVDFITGWLDVHWQHLNLDHKEKLQRALRSMPRPYQYVADSLKKSIDGNEKFSPTEHFPHSEKMAKLHDVFKAFPHRDGGATAHLADLQGLSTTPSSDPFVAETRKLLRKPNLTRTQLMAELEDAARRHSVELSVPSHSGSDGGAMTPPQVPNGGRDSTRPQ